MTEPFLSHRRVMGTRSVHTTLRAKLNEWVEIGSTQDSRQTERQGFFTHQRSTANQAMKIMLKVEMIEN